MMNIKGIGVSPGIAFGNVIIVNEANEVSSKVNIESIENELARLNNAINESTNQLKKLYDESLKKIGPKEAEIFEAHLLMLQDEDFTGKIKEDIKSNKINAEWAVENTRDFYVSMFLEMESDYMKERAADIIDISKRLMNILTGQKSNILSKIEKESIVVAKDLTPSDTAQMDKEKVLGILTEVGGKTSHSAIIARSLGIPAVVGIPRLMESLSSNDFVVFDGESGSIFINPSEEILIEYKEKKKAQDEQKKLLEKLKGTESVTTDGRKIEVAANIATVKDLKSVIENDAEGIGLFRTEFLFMDRQELPSEEEQFEAYREVAEKMGRKSIIIRTLDIGGDKAAGYLDIPKEDNPFLGYRAIRLCLDKKEIFKTQLRAILRASAHGSVKIMFPMIATIEELREAKKILDDMKSQLMEERIPFNEHIETGIMIETPAAAVMSDVLAKEVDFFSIGTNDLIQYTLAVDRLNPNVSYLYSFYQPSVLRLIREVVENAHKEGIWVGMCGEAAREPELIPIWVGMGLDELSVSPGSILQVRDRIQKMSSKDAKERVKYALEFSTEEEIRLGLS